MAFTLDKIVPWGRSFDEYVGMFALTDADLSGHILGCGDGPASFNAEATRRGCTAISCDPIYRFPATGIERRVRETYGLILAQLRQNRADYIWETIASPEELGRLRMSATQRFLEDYPCGRAEGRYLDASLPVLPFPDGAFDLALCSHLLFTYSKQLSPDFHRDAITEMCRVAKEVRIFPLLDIGGEPPVYMEPLAAELVDAGYAVRFVKVAYEFQKGADTFLCVFDNRNGGNKP